MQALVLVGGKGTRLQPLTTEIPKPILTLVDRPFLGYMIEWLASHGVDEVLLACGFLPDQLQEVLGDGAEGGPRLRYLVEQGHSARRGRSSSFAPPPGPLLRSQQGRAFMTSTCRRCWSIVRGGTS